MTDSSMNFGPAWIRNLHSEPSVASSGTRYQLAEYRYGREEMLALFDKSVKPPHPLVTFKTLYSDQTQIPLALLPTTEEEQRSWQTRPTALSGASRGRGGSLERGGRVPRGRGGYQPYGRATSAHEAGWGNGEQPDWSPRKEFAPRGSSTDNWRRVRAAGEEEDGWRTSTTARPLHEKWTRSTSWRGEAEAEPHRNNWHGGQIRRSWDNEDHLPEWAMENPTEGGGTFDERGAFHGSDDEHDGRSGGGKHEPLQKSVSQQNIGNKAPPLTSSKSALSLSKYSQNNITREEKDDLEVDVASENHSPTDKERAKENHKQRHEKRSENELVKEVRAPGLVKLHQSSDRSSSSNDGGTSQDSVGSNQNVDKGDEDFERLQEDLVLKLVVDEEAPKPAIPNNFDVNSSTSAPAPPNLVQQPPPPAPANSQEKWYYQDPQGIRQGPFLNVEMAEWFKAGYFSNQLNVMRDCDERYFLLGELITLCSGENPFLSNIRFPILKNDAKIDDSPLHFSILAQLAQFKQQPVAPPPPPTIGLAEPWSALSLQQQELAAKRLLLQQQQLSHDLQFMQQTSAPSNPLMYMINQMQQSNKLPSSVMSDKPANSVPNQLDPVLAQMANPALHPLQQRLQNPSLHNPLPGNLPAGMPDNLTTNLSNLPPNMPGLHGNITRPPPMEQHMDPVYNFLKQYQQQQRQQAVESLWHKQNFNATPTPPVSTPTSQWQQTPTEPPLGMWDMKQQQTEIQQQQQPATTNQQHSPQQEKVKKESVKEEKEVKKRKELDEKQAKKDADERRKQEQRRQEVEKKLAEEKKRKDDDKKRKELEKAKKDADEKRLKELEEKRRLKEQRKAEEEARKKNDDVKKDDDKNRRDTKAAEDRNKIELARLVQNAASASSKSGSSAKSAPWSQTNSTLGMSLSDIQKAEKEKRAQEAAILLQRQQQMMQEQHQHQLQQEKQTSLQLNWAKKPVETQKVKSFAEIQAEEQENLLKMTAEARLAQLKEKETTSVQNNPASIWNGQSLTWASVSSTSQWGNANNSGGFWDDLPTEKKLNKPSVVSKSNSTSAMTAKQPQQQQPQPPKPVKTATKTKKDESSSAKTVNNNNNSTNRDEFTEWCHKTMSNLSTDIDIPTFVTFLRDIESAYDVRDYCKEYLGDSPATQQFATNFLEKRRSFKPKSNAPKDDMCSPAPAITPSMQHNNADFQEVKGKNKKNKKSKMLKVDSRILGFNVTSAPDRINVGDRDYGES